MRPGEGQPRRLTASLGGLVLALSLARAEPVTIRYACTSSGDNLKSLNRVVAEFEAANPGIHVKVEPVVDNYENKLLSMVAAKVAPDVATINPNRFAQFAARGVFRPLDEFPDLGGPEADVAGRYANLVDAYRLGGRLYALPRDVACSAYLYYNKRLFREAGIPYPDGSWTWDTKVRPELREKDFVWVMARLTKRRDGERRPVQYGFAPSWPQLWMDTLLMSSDVRMWDDDRNPRRLFLDDPKVVEIFRFAADVPNRFHWMPSSSDVTLGSGSTMQDEFRKGRVAMLESGAWEVKDMRAKMRDDWDIAPFPTFARGSSAHLPGEGNALGILASSPHPQEAWEWVKWFCGPKGLVPMARAGESQPSIRALCLQPGVWLPPEGAAAPPEHLAITDAVAARAHYRPLPEWFASGVASDIQGAVYGVLSGEQKPETVLATLQGNEPAKLALARRRVASPPYPFGLGVAVGAALVAALLAWIYLPERGRRLSRVERAENRSAYLFLIPWLVGLAFTAGPMIYSLLLSFADSDIIRTPTWRGVGNYADLLNPAVDDTFFVSLKQTFLFAAVSVPLGVAAALALSLLLNQKVRGIPLFRALYYLPSLASAVAMSLIWQRLFDRDAGLINAFLYGPDGHSGFLGLGPWLSRLVGTPGEAVNWLGNSKTVIPAFVLMGLWGAGGGTIIFLAGLQAIPTSYQEAATLDGAGAWKRFRNVTLPMLTPYVFFSLITGVIGALQVFGQSFVLTDGGPDRATLFMVVWLYKKAFGELKMGYASAIAWLLFVVILAFTLLQLAAARKWVYYEGELK